jgi:hypothetical protein
MIEDMIRKFKLNKNKIINPLKENPQTYIKIIKELKSLENPSKHLNFSISSDAQSKLKISVRELENEFKDSTLTNNLKKMDEIF